MPTIHMKVYAKDKPLMARLKAMPWHTLKQVPVDTVPFGARALTCFAREGVKTLDDLVKLREFDLLKMQGLGRLSVAHVKFILKELGQHLVEHGSSVEQGTLDFSGASAEGSSRKTEMAVVSISQPDAEGKVDIETVLLDLSSAEKLALAARLLSSVLRGTEGSEGGAR